MAKVKKAFLGTIAGLVAGNALQKKAKKKIMEEGPQVAKMIGTGGASALAGMKKGGKVTKAKTGKQMLKRADGTYSQRGLWDNIRANKGSGKKPTAAMLKQEKKIKSKSKK